MFHFRLLLSAFCLVHGTAVEAFAAVRVPITLAVSALLLCVCRGADHQKTPAQATVQPQTVATVPASTDTQPATDTTGLQVGQKPGPGSTPTATGEPGPPPQNTDSALKNGTVAVTGTHLATPP